jgi:hypothetical protein
MKACTTLGNGKYLLFINRLSVSADAAIIRFAYSTYHVLWHPLPKISVPLGKGDILKDYVNLRNSLTRFVSSLLIPPRPSLPSTPPFPQKSSSMAVRVGSVSTLIAHPALTHSPG